MAPNWFASVMGTGIVANAALLLPHRSEALRDAAFGYLTRESGSGTRAVAAAALASAGVELTPALELASTQSVKRALEGGGFSLLSRLAIEAELAAGSVHALPLRDGGLHRELRAVRRRGPASAATRAFWAWLTALPERDE